jgi:hypothetical protein
VASLYSIETSTIAKRGGTGSIELQSDIVPKANTNPVSLGSTGFEFSNVYAKNLHGVLPYPTTVEPTIGSVFFACVKRVSGAAISSCTPGYTIQTGDGYIEHVYYGVIRAGNAPASGTAMIPTFDAGNEVSNSTTRKFMALSKFEFITGYDYAFGFAMRIA